MSIFFISCASQPSAPPKLEPFNTDALTTVLTRGASTMDEVREALGAPNGSGSALLPTAEGPRKVWFYEKMKASMFGAAPSVEQHVLMVFFKDDRFDGFLWFSGGQ